MTRFHQNQFRFLRCDRNETSFHEGGTTNHFRSPRLRLFFQTLLGVELGSYLINGETIHTSSVIVTQYVLQSILYTSPTTKCSAKHKSLKFIGFRGHSVLQNATEGIYKMPPANNIGVSEKHRTSEKK